MMFYQKFISIIFLLLVCSFFHSKLKAQESAFPEFKYLGKVHGGNFIYDDVYDLTYNPSNHSVAFTNGELFGFMVISLDSLKIIFDNRKLKKNRFSIKSAQTIIFPFNLSANSRGNFVFYDFSSNKRLRFVGKGNQFNNAFIKEITVLPNNSIAYQKILEIDEYYLNSYLDSDSFITSFAARNRETNVYTIIKQYWLQSKADTFNLASLSKMGLEGEDFFNYSITTYKNNPLIYSNHNRFMIIPDSLNISNHYIEMPYLDTGWVLNPEEFDIFYESYPVINVFEMGEKACFFYRSKFENEEARYFISVYSFDNKTTEMNFEIPREFCVSQTNPLPVAEYDSEHLLFLRVDKGFYEFYTLKL